MRDEIKFSKGILLAAKLYVRGVLIMHSTYFTSLVLLMVLVVVILPVIGLIKLVALIIKGQLDDTPAHARSERGKTFGYRYIRKEYFLTTSEHDFFNTLTKILGDSFYVFPQIQLSALFGHKVYGQGWRGALSHIQRKSVDFVICDKKNLRPLLAIELDDSSHEESRRVSRDREVENIFSNAGMPLIRFQNSERFNIELVSTKVYDTLRSQINVG